MGRNVGVRELSEILKQASWGVKEWHICPKANRDCESAKDPQKFNTYCSNPNKKYEKCEEYWKL